MAVERGTCHFIQFAREPLSGQVKTRMQPRLSAAQACSLHSELVLRTTRTLVQARLGPVELAVAGNPGHPLFRQCRRLGVTTMSTQSGTGLGQRMYLALAAGLQLYERVVLVGSDCPGIDRDYLRAALKRLNAADVVLGPALDGGYVLIGARRIEPGVFEGLRGGTPQVLAQTRRALRGLGLAWKELPPLQDIDRPEDLAGWERLRDR